MEYLELYDKLGNDLHEKIEREKKFEIEKGKYFRVVLIYIQNQKGEFLIQKVSKEKGDIFATTGGHVQAGSTPQKTAVNEIKEELGIIIKEEELELFNTEFYPNGIQDVYFLKKELDISKLTIQKEEVESVEWMTQEQIMELIKTQKFRKGNQSSFYKIIQKKTI